MKNRQTDIFDKNSRLFLCILSLNCPKRAWIYAHNAEFGAAGLNYYKIVV